MVIIVEKQLSSPQVLPLVIAMYIKNVQAAVGIAHEYIY